MSVTNPCIALCYASAQRACHLLRYCLPRRDYTGPRRDNTLSWPCPVVKWSGSLYFGRGPISHPDAAQVFVVKLSLKKGNMGVESRRPVNSPLLNLPTGRLGEVRRQALRMDRIVINNNHGQVTLLHT